MLRFSRRKMYTLQPGATAPSRSNRSRFKGMRKKLSRRYRRPHSFRYPRHRPLVSTDSMILHELVPSLPMPSEQELNLKFIAMVDELGLNREIMLKLPLQKKWQLYLSKQKDQQAALGSDQPQPQFYVEELIHFNSIVANASIEQADLEGNLKAVKDLKTALRTQPISFVLHFIDLNGLEHMLDFLRRMNSDIRQSQLHYVIMGCIKALMNNPNGRAHVLAHPTGITVIAQSLRTTNLKTKILTLEILGALCLVPGGHKKVLTAVVHFQQFACERTRFQTLLMDLTRSLDEEQEAANLQVAIFSFFNALINYKTGEESLEFRLHVRHELLMLGIQPIINRLRSLNIAQLNKHLEIFDFIRIEDEREFSLRLQLMETVEYTNPLKMAEILHKKTAYTAAYTHYVSILYHCLLIPIDDPYYDKYWRLIDRMVQQAVIQQDHGVDPDVSPLPINIQKLILHLLKEDEQKALIRQMEEMKKAQDHMAGRLKRMEWDCETKTMERDGLRATVDKQKVQLEQQQEDLYQTKERQRTTERSLTLASQQVEELKLRCQQLESRLKEKNVDISDLPPVVVPVVAPPPPPPPAPPPLPPGPPGVVPPPPPPGSGVFAVATLRRRKKNIPKPSSQLKSLNWVKLHDAEIQGTVWDKLDDTKIFGVLNLEDLEKNFYQKPTRDSVHFLTLPRNEQQKKEISFIEKKRAQNCTILLSRLKMNDEQIRKLVLSMDEDMRLGKDMVEQLLKYVPMKSEIDELQIHLHEIEKFSRADKFMWGMSQVPRYHERLRALYFKKTFDERMGEVCPQIQDILAACHELMLSGRLQKVLEVVLALGNFMNKGSRGNASGFKLASLNKIVDTKSSADSSNNLMHFLLQSLEAQFPDTLSVEVELPHVRNAAKVELFELEKEFRTLQTDLQDLKDELDIHRKTPSGDPDDRFVTAVEDFAIRAAIKVRETDMLLKEMKEQFQKALHFFGEDPTSTTTDKFMGIFLTFFKSFDEAHVQIIAQRKKKAEVEKRKKHEEQRKTETLRRREQRERKARSSHVLMKSEGAVDDGNLDELIDKLKNGEIWHVMGQAKRRSRKLPTNGFGKAFFAMGLDTNRERTDSPTELQ